MQHSHILGYSVETCSKELSSMNSGKRKHFACISGKSSRTDPLRGIYMRHQRFPFWMRDGFNGYSATDPPEHKAHHKAHWITPRNTEGLTQRNSAVSNGLGDINLSVKNAFKINNKVTLRSHWKALQKSVILQEKPTVRRNHPERQTACAEIFLWNRRLGISDILPLTSSRQICFPAEKGKSVFSSRETWHTEASNGD